MNNDEDTPNPLAEGRQAFLAGQRIWTNPYDPDEGQEDFKKWADGWLAAQQEAHDE